MNFLLPPTLKPGDKVAILSPASAVLPEYIDAAVASLQRRGFVPVVFPHAKEKIEGNYAGTEAVRIADFKSALRDTSIRAILCARGGYGAVHLLPAIEWGEFAANPKWIIGFSDISALHARALAEGVGSIHSPMAKDIDTEGGDLLFKILTTGKQPEYFMDRGSEDSNLPKNSPGDAEGVIMGGNLAVLQALIATPSDIFARVDKEDTILFIEDVAEPVYKVERIMYQLLLMGVLHKIKGLAVGRFTEYRHPEGEATMENMISRILSMHGLIPGIHTTPSGRQDWLPVAFGLPVGHVDDNRPILEGSRIRLSINPSSFTLSPTQK